MLSSVKSGTSVVPKKSLPPSVHLAEILCVLFALWPTFGFNMIVGALEFFEVQIAFSVNFRIFKISVMSLLSN